MTPALSLPQPTASLAARGVAQWVTVTASPISTDGQGRPGVWRWEG